MVQKLAQPEFEPVYELDQRLDTILGYDHLLVAVHALASQYPDDEYHSAVREVADMSINTCREDEVGQALGTAHNIRQARLTYRIGTITDVDGVKRRYREQSRVIMELEKSPDGLFETTLSEATSDERQLIREVVNRRIEAAKRDQESIAQELSEIGAGTDYVKAVLARPIPKLPTPVENMDIPKPRAENVTDPTIRALNLLSDILRSTKGGLTHEPELVRALYPQLYTTDRPAAYQKFDETYGQFSDISHRVWSVFSGAFIQKGRLHKANQAGRPVDGQSEIVYRAVYGDQESIIQNKGGVQQRLAIDQVPHVVDWDCVVPQWRKSA